MNGGRWETGEKRKKKNKDENIYLLERPIERYHDNHYIWLEKKKEG
jgi:hypothetical protein